MWYSFSNCCPNSFDEYHSECMMQFSGNDASTEIGHYQDSRAKAYRKFKVAYECSNRTSHLQCRSLLPAEGWFVDHLSLQKHLASEVPHLLQKTARRFRGK